MDYSEDGVESVGAANGKEVTIKTAHNDQAKKWLKALGNEANKAFGKYIK